MNAFPRVDFGRRAGPPRPGRRPDARAGGAGVAALLALGLAAGSQTWPAGGSATPLVCQVSDPEDRVPDRRQFGPSSRRCALTICEIMYHPPPRADGASLEYLELRNTEPVAADISGWRLSGDVEYRFPAGTVVAPQGVVVVAADPRAFVDAYPVSDVLGPFAGSLPDGGGRVRLRHAFDALLLEVDYDDDAPWPAAADGAGHALVLARPDFGEADPRAWAAGDLIGGSPGLPEFWSGGARTRVVINEFVAHTDPDADLVELYNAGTQAVDLAGCRLTDDPALPGFTLPAGTLLPAGGFAAFDQQQLGFALNMHGDGLFLVDPAGGRVLDAIRFGAQANGVACGRFPDGAAAVRPLESPTPGRPNVRARVADVVINEIMYHPLRGDSAEEYVELHNRGAAAADVGYWRFTAGIDCMLPAGTRIPPGGFLVVAQDAGRLRSQYPQLNATNTVGNFGGTLADRGERLVLARPDDPALPYQDFVEVDSVAYGDGWGAWADGGGSSLELIDPRSDNSLAPNWAGSDETAKAPWTAIACTGTAMPATEQITTAGTIALDELHVYALFVGECLLDEVRLEAGAGTIKVDELFEGGLNTWQALGTHQRSRLDAGAGLGGSTALRLVASGPGDTIFAADQRPPPYYNRLVKPLGSAVASGTAVTLRAQARWQAGHPYVLLGLKAFACEAVGVLTVPLNLGTPGLVNSRCRAAAGPALTDLQHSPPLPAANQPVTVTCRVDAPDGAPAVTLRHRVDPATTWAAAAMRDDGAAPDRLAGDGVYTATLPGRAAGTLAAYYVTAGAGAVTNRLPGDAIYSEALVRYGDAADSGSLTTYRLWLTAARIAEWNARHTHNNDPLPGTFVYGNDRVVHGAGARYRGNWRPFNGPTGSTPCGYVITLPAAERVLGDSELKIDMAGQTGADTTFQRERLVYDMGAAAGIPSSHVRFIRMRVNEADRGVRYDLEAPVRSFAESWLGDADPAVFRVMHDNGLGRYFTPEGGRNQARYRASFEKKQTDVPNDDYGAIFTLADHLSTAGTACYEARSLAVLDVAEWLAVVAINHATVNSDAFGYGLRHNAYLYAPWGGRARTFYYDLDNALQTGDSPTASLFTTTDARTQAMFDYLPFRRLYWRALAELAASSLRPDVATARLQAWYAVFQAEGLGAANPSAVATWIGQRHAYLTNQLAGVASPFAIVTHGGTSFSTNTPYADLRGVAPVQVAALTVNGRAQVAAFTSLTEWRLRTPLAPGANPLVVQGLDRFGRPLAGATAALVVTTAARPPDPGGNLVISEIMYAAPRPGGDFVELYNRSPTQEYALGGLRLDGVDYTFPDGVCIGPTGYVVVAENLAAYAQFYTNAEAVAGAYAGSLDDGGETLRLLQPAANGAWTVLDQVRYDDDPPWPAAAKGGGKALQLIDAGRDNSRVGNWAVAADSVPPRWQRVQVTGTAGSAVSAARLHLYLEGAGSVVIDDVRLVAGADPDAEPNLLANGSFEEPLAPAWTASLNHQGSALTPAPVSDGASALCLVATGPGSAAGRIPNSVNQGLAGLVPSAVYTLSFRYWTTPGAQRLAAVVSQTTLAVTRQTQSAEAPPAAATPGGANSVAATLAEFPPLWINEVMPSNTVTRADQAGAYEPWIELYNAGAAPLALGESVTLSNDPAALARWVFPAGAAIGAGERLLVWADGEPAEGTPAEPHAAFRLNGQAGCVILGRLAGDTVQVLDALTYDRVPPGASLGSVPEGSPADRLVLHLPTPGQRNVGTSGAVPVAINEWMSANTATLADPADGDFDDWFELYNRGDTTLYLGGFEVTDTPGATNRYALPGGTVLPPRGCLLVWADNETGQNRPGGAPHVPFKLSRDGEALALYAPDGTCVDALSFGPQDDDEATGRWPDGAGARHPMAPPTPGAPNRVLQLGAVTPPAGDPLQLTWEAERDRVYRVESCAVLSAHPAWTPLGTVTSAAAGRLTLQDPAGSGVPTRFYRVRCLK